jgi:hypothetical protein
MPCTAPALLFLQVLLAAAAAAAAVAAAVVVAAEEDFGISQIACCVTILRGVTCTGDVPKELRVRKTAKDGRLQEKTVGRRGIHRLGLHVLSEPPLGGGGGTR